MQIGQISKQTGYTVDAIRFYERSGLLAAPPRSDGGFRLYSRQDISSLQFIRNLQSLGFSLGEIREFLSLRNNGLRACTEVRKKLDRKLKDVHAKRIALINLEEELKAAMRKCNFQLKRRRRKKNGDCPVLTVFSTSQPRGGM
ncbi:MAG: heavy metal-responsive transcriptional regulator [Acidobacteriota bacterium]|nr:heavy metal-responsive transcriptional regulator [Acidobacteriota bacterium]